MDFLPRPQKPLHRCPEIRLLSLEQYDGGDFYTYPERQGWKPRTPEQWNICFQNPTLEFTAMLERWLLFGYLFAYFGENLIRNTNFVIWKGDPLYPVLTMQELPRLLSAVKASDNVHNVRLLYEITRLHRDLMLADGDVSSDLGVDDPIRLDQFISTFARPDVRSSYISLLTTIIMEMFTSTLYQLVNKRPALGGQLKAIRMTASTMLYPEFRMNGWCPADLVTVIQRFNTSCFYFLLNLTNPQPYVDHISPLAAETSGTSSHEIALIEVSPGKDSKSSSAGESEVATIHVHGQIANYKDKIQLCTPQRCNARVLTDREYTTRHAWADCHCEYVEADTSKLCEILKRGSIPLIVPVDPDDDLCEITFVEAQPDTKYVAISHVWSDGLGNPSKNAIPRCQLQRLSRYVSDVPDVNGENLYFWFDTICIPPDKICGCTCSQTSEGSLCDPPCSGREVAGAQTKSLELMRKTYQDAEVVLVLDSWLLETTCQGKSHVENLLRIFTSTWTRRLWTYQEGFLAKSLHIQFLDSSFDIDKAIVELQELADIITRFTFLSPIMAGYWELRHSTQSHRLLRGSFWDIALPLPTLVKEKLLSGEYAIRSDEGSWVEDMYPAISGEGPSPDLKPLPKRSPAEKLARRLITVASAVYHRSTSVTTDEPLCLAALLDLDVGKIADTRPIENRMLEFWRMFRLVPRQLLFLREPKINYPHFRWAPRSLLRTSQPVLPYNYEANGLSSWWDSETQFLEVCEDGRLAIHTKGFILPVESRTITLPFFLRLPEIETIHHVEPETSDSSDPNIPFNKGIDATRDYGCKELAIVSESIDSDMTQESSCILVAVEKKQNNSVECRRICSVKLAPLAGNSHNRKINSMDQDMKDHLSDIEPGGGHPGGGHKASGVMRAMVALPKKEAYWFIG